jgi:pyroglutamyl-peptidase
MTQHWPGPATLKDSEAMRVVLAGFGPFPGAPFNPSAVLAQRLARRHRPALARLARRAHVFATSYAAVDHDLPELFADKPEIVLLFGLAAGRRHVCVETRARNAVSVLFPDAERYRPTDQVIARDGPDARYGRAPVPQMVGALRTANVPARASCDAGRYLCNYVYWRALEQANGAAPLVAFVHIPAMRRNRRPRRRPAKRWKHRPPSLAALVAAAERLLIALVAASRR